MRWRLPQNLFKQGIFLLSFPFFFFCLFLCFSYDNFFNHLNDHDYDHDDYTSTPTTLQPTPKAAQRIETAMAAAAVAARNVVYFTSNEMDLQVENTIY